LLHIHDHAQHFKIKLQLKQNFLLEIENRFLRLIVKYLFAWFHRNTSKSQTWSTLNCSV